MRSVLKKLITIAVSLAAQAGAKESVAVLDMVNQIGQATALSSYLADELSIQQAADTNVQLIERGQLARILEEQGIQNSGAFDEKTIVKIGNLSGATRVVVGKYYPLGDVYEVVFRAVDVKTAKVAKIGKTNLQRTESLAKVDATGLPGGQKMVGQSMIQPEEPKSLLSL